MRSVPGTRRPLLASTLVLGLGIVLGGCGGSAPSTPSATTVPTAPGVTARPTAAGTQAPEPTEVPGGPTGGATGPVEPPATAIPTTQTEWGAIMDALPQGFPVFPDAVGAEPPAEPVSGALIAAAGVDEVATWYRDALEATGKSTLDLSSPLEDGSRVLDMQGDLPECRLRLTFRPEGESTMITVLVAAGCVGGGG
jgi:hypothetical protein